MRVVVTGATGNVGTAVLRRLAQEPQIEEIIGVARRLPAEPHADPRVRWMSLDVARDALVPVLTGAQALIHLAWAIQPSHEPERLRAVNVEGTRRVLEAAVTAGVETVVVASSVGAYSPAPRGQRVDESWPTGGIATSDYSMEKAEVERILDDIEQRAPHMRVVRLRPGLTFQSSAASEIVRYFIGPLIPRPFLRPALLPLLPLPAGIQLQAVHADDIADAYARSVLTPVRGAFNIAAEPDLDAQTLSTLLGVRSVTVAPSVFRVLIAIAWRLRLVPVAPGWLEMGLYGPFMDTQRAHHELHWSPKTSAGDALAELLAAMPAGVAGSSPVLQASPGASTASVVKAAETLVQHLWALARRFSSPSSGTP